MSLTTFDSQPTECVELMCPLCGYPTLLNESDYYADMALVCEQCGYEVQTMSEMIRADEVTGAEN